MLGELLDRLGIGRHEPPGKALVRGRAIARTQCKAAPGESSRTTVEPR